MRPIAPIVVALVALAGAAAANPASRALRREAYARAYELDHDLALATFKRAIAADPNDSACYRGYAVITWLNLLFRRGAITVDDYLGSVTRPNLDVKQPPAEVAVSFHQHIDKALALAEVRLRANRNDLEAHYDVGAAIGQLAIYTATVEGRLLGGFRAARRAYDEHERVLEADPRRKDAGLTVGTYRYIVANLALPIRLMAYVVGFGGDAERGVRLIEDAARYPSDVQIDAKIALVFLYNRERRFDDAMRILRELQVQYPKNRLFWLEAGATALRAGRAHEAERILTEGLAKLKQDPRPRAFGEEAAWHYKYGAALVALDRLDEARRELNAAMASEGRRWIKGRTHTELGKLHDLAGERVAAKAEYQTAYGLCSNDSDPVGATAAERLLQNPYRK